MIRLGGAIESTPTCRVEDPDSNLGPGENFSLKLTTNEMYVGGILGTADSPINLVVAAGKLDSQ